MLYYFKRRVPIFKILILILIAIFASTSSYVYLLSNDIWYDYVGTCIIYDNTDWMEVPVLNKVPMQILVQYSSPPADDINIKLLTLDG
jgi:hypothetical protein